MVPPSTVSACEAAKPPEPPGEGRPDQRGCPNRNPGIDWNELLTSPPLPAAKIAEKLEQPANLVERVLRYQRSVMPFCFIVDDSPQKGDARYLHKMPDVLPALKKWMEKRLKKQSKAPV